jgi:hypothetical protein
MRTQEIRFSNSQSFCVFPADSENVQQSIAELKLNESYPVIVLIGGYVQNEHADITQKAVHAIAKIAEEQKALVICGATNLGVMSLIGKIRIEKQYAFPLLGITVGSLVTWPGGPRSGRFLWWGKKRWQLAPGYSHLILTPGKEFGDESPWIVDAATVLSKGKRSVTVLIEGGAIARKDINLSLKANRTVIALAGTGRLADELASQTEKPENVISVPAAEEHMLIQTIENYLQRQK